MSPFRRVMSGLMMGASSNSVDGRLSSLSKAEHATLTLELLVLAVQQDEKLKL